MQKIGFIVAKQSGIKIEKIKPQLQKICDLHVFTYTNLDEIKDIYLSNYLLLDGIIFGGSLAHNVLLQELDSFPIHTDYIEINERDFYAMMFSLLANKKIDSTSRLAVDFLGPYNNYFGLSKLLPEHLFPKIPIQAKSSMIFSYDIILKFHLLHWEQNKVDLSITRYSNIAQDLTDNDVDFIHLYPSQQTIIEKFQHTIKGIQMEQLVDNQIAIGYISIKDLNLEASTSEYKRKKTFHLYKALLKFSADEHLLLNIEIKESYLEIITSLKSLKEKITGNYTNCSLLSFLNNKINLPVSIGWGCGSTIHSARINAENANERAKLNQSSCSFVVNENNEFIGPLGKRNLLRISNLPDKQVKKWSDKFNVSSLQIQKTLAIMEQINTNKLSSNVVSYYLDITLRSANRFLNILEEKGIATVSYKRHEKLRGRPQKIYTINFD